MNTNHFICIDQNNNIKGFASNFYNQNLLNDVLNLDGSCIKQIVQSDGSTIILKTDGTLIGNAYIAKYYDIYKNELENLTNIKQIDNNIYATIILFNNGTCKFIGEDKTNQSDGINKWTDLKQIAINNAYQGCTVGLKYDGTCLFQGDNAYNKSIISTWKNIKQISFGYTNVYGLTKENKVISNISGDFENWTDIIKIATGHEHIVGLKKDGTVVSDGNDCDYGILNTSKWNNIIDITCGAYYTIGLKSDGTLIGSGIYYNDKSEKIDINESIKDFKNIKLLPSNDIYRYIMNKYLIRQKNKYYSIDLSYYNNENNKYNEIDINNNYKEYGFKNLNKLFQNTKSLDESFKPINKFGEIKHINEIALSDNKKIYNLNCKIKKNSIICKSNDQIINPININYNLGTIEFENEVEDVYFSYIEICPFDLMIYKENE